MSASQNYIKNMQLKKNQKKPPNYFRSLTARHMSPTSYTQVFYILNIGPGLASKRYAMSLIVLIGLILKIRLLSTENIAMNVKIILKITHFSWPIVLLSTTYYLTSSDFSFSLAVFFFFVAPLRRYRPLKNRHRSLTWQVSVLSPCYSYLLLFWPSWLHPWQL